MSREAAKIMHQVAVMSELIGENSFKVRSYYQAARVLKRENPDLEALAGEGKLETIPGIGKAISEKLALFLETGTFPLLDRLREKIPPGVMDMLKISGIGPKKVRQLWCELGFEDLKSLQKACLDGTLSKVKGFGKKTQEKILEGIAFIRATAGKCLFFDGRRRSSNLEEKLKSAPGVKRVSPSGEIRRVREVVNRLDFVLEGSGGEDFLEYCRNLDSLSEVTGDSKALVTAVHSSGQSVHFHLSPRDFALTLLITTGSEEHLEALEERARKEGCEFDWKNGSFKKDGKKVKLKEERDFYSQLNLDYIPPELRENQGEIAAAAEGQLPQLVEMDDLQAVLHNHTTWSDGTESTQTMAETARDLGYRFISINDHSQAAHYAGGLDPKRVSQQMEEIDEVNQTLTDIRILSGTEVDILADGQLDFDDELLEKLQVVVASIHSQFQLSRDEQTARLVGAAQNPHVDIIGHPTGRLLLQREGYDVDLERVLEVCSETGTAIEINANPRRLDLDWRLVKKARDMGITLCVNPDAHSRQNFDFVETGLLIARKGWLEAGHLLNVTLAEQYA